MPSPIKNLSFLVFVVIFLLYIAVGISGYGNDWDTYGLINSGRNIVQGGEYFPSRSPGYFIPELIIGVLSLIGGFYLTNALSALLATLSLVIFFQLLTSYFNYKDALLLTLLVAVNPVFVIAATSTIDYIYSIFCILLGVFFYVKRLPYIAGIFLGLGVGCRLSNSLMVSITCLYFLYDGYVNQSRKALLHIVFSMGIAVALSLLCYLPAFISAHYSLAFLTYYMADFNWLDHVSRFVYKNVYLFGVLPMLVIVCSIISARINRSFYWPRHLMVIAGIVMVLIQELLFLKIPLEVSYLLPLLFVIFPLWFLMFNPVDLIKYALLITTLLYGLVFNIELLDIEYNAEGTVAVKASVRPSIKVGAIVNDVLLREESAKKYSTMFNVFE